MLRTATLKVHNFNNLYSPKVRKAKEDQSPRIGERCPAGRRSIPVTGWFWETLEECIRMSFHDLRVYDEEESYERLTSKHGTGRKPRGRRHQRGKQRDVGQARGAFLFAAASPPVLRHPRKLFRAITLAKNFRPTLGRS